MSLRAPGLVGLPEIFPVFPLSGALLLPNGKLPLNIFEPRYRALTDDALAPPRMFGMIQPDVARPAGERGPGLCRIGCLGRLSSFSEAEGDRYLVALSGVIRFVLVEEVEMRRGYRRVRGEFSRFADDLLSPDDLPPACDRAELLTVLRRYFASRGIEANWEAVEQMPDDTLVTTLCMVCPFEPQEKQALLEAATPTDRASALMALLQMGAHAQSADQGSGRSQAS